jgi:hypothetical protein
VDRAELDLETIDLGRGDDTPRTRRGCIAGHRLGVTFAVAFVMVVVGVWYLVVYEPHGRVSVRRAPARTLPSRVSTTAVPQPVHPDEPILGRFYPFLGHPDTTTIVFPSGLKATLSGGVTDAIGGLGAIFFGAAAPKNAAACCALSFTIEHAAPSDLFATLGANAISTPALVSSSLAVQPDYRQVPGRFGILSTGDWTLIARYEDGAHAASDDVIVLELLDAWHLRSTPNGPVVGLPANSFFDTMEIDFGRTPDLTDREVDLAPFCTATKRTLVGSDAQADGFWCEHGLHVNVNGPRPYVKSVIAHLNARLDSNG